MSYLHSYESVEQERLLSQAALIQPFLYQGWEQLGQPNRILEVGCGVGAQLHFLAHRYPEAQLTGLDRSSEQLAKAASHLRGVELVQGQAESMPFADASFDLVCVYFVLEHVLEPSAVIREIDRVLSPSGFVAISEVHNPSLYFYPACPAASAYWALYNRLQRELGGDPEIGVKLPFLVRQPGWKQLNYSTFSPRLDGSVESAEGRDEVTRFWLELMRSVEPSLKERGWLKDPFQQVERELETLRDRPDGVIDYCARQILAQKPS